MQADVQFARYFIRDKKGVSQWARTLECKWKGKKGWKKLVRAKVEKKECYVCVRAIQIVWFVFQRSIVNSICRIEKCQSFIKQFNGKRDWISRPEAEEIKIWKKIFRWMLLRRALVIVIVKLRNGGGARLEFINVREEESTMVARLPQQVLLLLILGEYNECIVLLYLGAGRVSWIGPQCPSGSARIHYLLRFFRQHCIFTLFPENFTARRKIDFHFSQTCETLWRTNIR